MAGAGSDGQSDVNLLSEEALHFKVRFEAFKEMSIRTWPKYVFLYVGIPIISGSFMLMGYSIFKEIPYSDLYYLFFLGLGIVIACILVWDYDEREARQKWKSS